MSIIRLVFGLKNQIAVIWAEYNLDLLHNDLYLRVRDEREVIRSVILGFYRELRVRDDGNNP